MSPRRLGRGAKGQGQGVRSVSQSSEPFRAAVLVSLGAVGGAAAREAGKVMNNPAVVQPGPTDCCQH